MLGHGWELGLTEEEGGKEGRMRTLVFNAQGGEEGKKEGCDCGVQA